MNPDKREEIRRSLRQLAETYAIDLVEKTLALVYAEVLANVPIYGPPTMAVPRQVESLGLVVDATLLTVTFRGRSCFLGNSLPFRLLARLAERPNACISHEILLRDVWQGLRSEGAIRSVVKVLRGKLRRAGLHELAGAIDGNVRGHYVLRLATN